MHQFCCSSKQLSHIRFRSSLALLSLLRSSSSSSSSSDQACCRYGNSSNISKQLWRTGRAAHVAAASVPKAKSTSSVLLASTFQDAVLPDGCRELEPPSSTAQDVAHVPVLLKEVIAQFQGRRLKSFVDCTFGAGGHASAIISTHPEMEVFLGMDVDPVAHAEAHPRLQHAAASHALSDSDSEVKILLKRSNFTNIKSIISEDPMLTIGGVDGILMDLGMSSMQVNEADRGFSFMKDGPADMRMDPTATLSAEVILNTWPEAEIGRILRDYGDERRWKYLARKIVEQRLSGGISTTSQLVEIIGGSSFIRTKGKHGRLKPVSHPATRTFQALRIAVNDELNSLELALTDAFSCLCPGGRLQVITFHSLEDRIVKQFFLNAAGLQKSANDWEDNNGDLSNPLEYKHIPGETRHSKYIRKKSHDNESGETTRKSRTVLEGPAAIILTRRPIAPSDQEVNSNPRSRSAKLRVLEKK
ncbi:unnamed protein product [Calypogeia fissa]